MAARTPTSDDKQVRPELCERILSASDGREHGPVRAPSADLANEQLVGGEYTILDNAPAVD